MNRNFIVTRDAVIEEAITSVKAHEKRPARRDAMIEGLDICRKIEKLDDFEAILALRHGEERDRRRLQASADEYWRFRYATAQIEHVFERMRVVENYGNSFSARAILQVDKITTKLRGHLEP